MLPLIAIMMFYNFYLLLLEIDKTIRRSNRKPKMHGYGVENKIKFIMGSLAN